jgi:hypothetical protein
VKTIPKCWREGFIGGFSVLFDLGALHTLEPGPICQSVWPALIITGVYRVSLLKLLPAPFGSLKHVGKRVDLAKMGTQPRLDQGQLLGLNSEDGEDLVAHCFEAILEMSIKFCSYSLSETRRAHGSLRQKNRRTPK